MKKNILNFCGVKPVKITSLSPLKDSDINSRNNWIGKIEMLGYQQN
jgi:hypothetical protein